RQNTGTHPDQEPLHFAPPDPVLVSLIRPEAKHRGKRRRKVPDAIGHRDEHEPARSRDAMYLANGGVGVERVLDAFTREDDIERRCPEGQRTRIGSYRSSGATAPRQLE